MPWLDNTVTEQLKKRDMLLKTARRTNSVVDWANYRVARNKAVALLRKSKSRFFTTTFEENKNNPKGIWKTIKTLIGNNKHKSGTSNSRNNGQILNNAVEVAEAFNLHFLTITDRLRTLIPNIPFDTSKLHDFVKSPIEC